MELIKNGHYDFIDQIGELEFYSWQLFKQGDEGARESLINLYLPYAKSIAAKYFSNRTLHGIEFNDYCQFAMIGLIDALNKFNPTHGAPFKSYAKKRIMGSICDGISSWSEIHQQVSWKRRIESERQESLCNHVVSDNSFDMLTELGTIGVGLAIGYILEGTALYQDEEMHLPDNAYGNLETNDLYRQLWQFVDLLPKREAKLVKLHYLHHHSFEEIALILNISKGRVSQLHKNIMLFLKQELINR